MNNHTNTYKYITTAATTTFAGETKRVILGSININKALTGNVTVKSGSTTIGIISSATLAGEYWYADGGTEIEDLQITNASSEDITVFYRNI